MVRSTPTELLDAKSKQKDSERWEQKRYGPEFRSRLKRSKSSCFC